VCSCPPGERQDCPDIDCDPCKEDPSLPECKPLPPPPGRDCHPSYPDACKPRPPPNLNCDDISFRNFKVIGSDPHGFDGDKDGVGCEGSGRGGGVPVLVMEATAIAMMIMMEFPHLQMNVKDKLIASEVQ
jgi:hypothetical protein